MYKQQAIIFKKDNAQLIADQLAYTTAQELLDEYDYLLTNHNTVILVRDIMDDGMALLSHVVTRSMFLANATAPLLSDVEFHDVTQL